MTITGFNPLNTEHCILSESRIDLWQFSLKHELHDGEQLLNPEERTRANRFYFSRHKRRFTTARATMRIILARYLNQNPEQLQFSYNPQGKPELASSQKIQFNLSHSGDLALLAVGKKFPMGVDIEMYSPRSYEGIARNLFSPQELDEFLKTPPAMKPALFFHIWSQKEAFIKACGMGLSYPTQEFHVPTTMPVKQLVEDPLNNTTWQMRSFMPQVACAGALCFNPAIRELRHGIIQLHQHATLRF